MGYGSIVCYVFTKVRMVRVLYLLYVQAEWRNEDGSGPPPEWPNEGRISLNNYSTR